MKRALGLAAIAAILLGWSGSAAAQGLNGLDRSLLYYYSFQSTLRNQEILRNQQKMNKQFQEFERQQMRQMSRPDPAQVYLREGRVSSVRNTPLPAIYSGQRDWFMRTNSFNPQQRR